MGVGETARNDLSDLIGAKRGLSNAKLFEFDVTKERSDEAGKRFTDSVRAFQGNRGLKIDGLMNPEGPTVKALRSLLFPQGTASNVGQPVDLSRGAARPQATPVSSNAPGGQSKFAAPRAALGDAPPAQPTGSQPGSSPDEEVEMAGRLRLPKGPGGKGLGKSPIPPMSKVVEEILDKLPSIKPPEGGPAKAEKPAHITVYPDGASSS